VRGERKQEKHFLLPTQEMGVKTLWFFKTITLVSTVAHACNPSNLGGRDRRIEAQNYTK
jgi:hypothetical protein